MVLSGKGGVGKNSLAVNLAVWLSKRAKNVGLLDVDIHGPSVPKLVNLEHTQVVAEDDKTKPLWYNDKLRIMSVGFLLTKDSDALIWRGPMKHNVISQFVTDVKKCITFCRRLILSVRGIVENMRGFVCPNCGHETNIFDGDGASF
jgi:Mrp family chromosome partitioning ATPase